MAPATVDAVRFNVEPAQIGPLFPAVGAEGVEATTRFTFAEAELLFPPCSVALTVNPYVPPVSETGVNTVKVAFVGLVAEVTAGGLNDEVAPAGNPVALRLAMTSAPLPLKLMVTV